MVMGVGSRYGGQGSGSGSATGSPEDTPEDGFLDDTSGDRRLGLWTLATILLFILSVAVFVSALQHSGRGGQPAVDEEQAALESAAAQAARPTHQQQADEVTAALDTIVDQISGQYHVTLGVSLRAGGGVVHSGVVEDARAWSSVKVPIAFAAVQKGLTDGTVDTLVPDLDLALTMSDNDAALRLWQTLGTDEQSSAAVDAVLRQAGDPTNAEADRNRDDYGGFGDIRWSSDDQVIFANRMACLPGAEQVLAPMGQVVAEHRQGLGLLPMARFKGGWGVEPDNTYLLREFGLVGEKDLQIPVAFVLRPDDGSDVTARQAAGALSGALRPLIIELADKGGVADCQVPESVPAPVSEPGFVLGR